AVASAAAAGDAIADGRCSPINTAESHALVLAPPHCRRAPMSREQFPDQFLIEEMAAAAYSTHHRPAAPVWRAAREEMREWARVQMRAALGRLRELEGQDK